MNKRVTVKQARQVLHEKFGGVLSCGEHDRDSGQCCVRELRTVCLDPTKWTDCPDKYLVGAGYSDTDSFVAFFNDEILEGSDDKDWVTKASELLLPLACLSEANASEGWFSRVRDFARSKLVRICGNFKMVYSMLAAAETLADYIFDDKEVPNLNRLKEVVSVIVREHKGLKKAKKGKKNAR